MELFIVDVTVKVVVAAKDNWAAMLKAHELREEIIKDNVRWDDWCCSLPLSEYNDLPTGWDDNCFPYGTPTDKTIKEIFEENK